LLRLFGVFDIDIIAFNLFAELGGERGIGILADLIPIPLLEVDEGTIGIDQLTCHPLRAVFRNAFSVAFACSFIFLGAIRFLIRR
jgi:hypothetical protein